MPQPTSVIVCGTDFSANARRASEVAAALAQRRGVKLVLLHFAEDVDDHAGKPEERQARLKSIKARLRQEAQRLRETGGTVEEVILRGVSADQAILEYVGSHPTQLVVVSSVSKTTFQRWTVGSVSERIAEGSPVPTLVVRSPYALLEWANQERTLNVFVSVDFSLSSDAALAWVGEMNRLGGCVITVAHVNWPPENHRSLAPLKVLPLTRNPPAVARQLTRELQKRVRKWLGNADVSFHVEPNWGRPDAALVSAAAAAQADLVVTGVHQRHGLDRMASASVSRGILRHTPANVACVPTPAKLAHGVGRDVHIRRILAATDFTPHGDQAIAWAYASLPAGGVVRLCHVLPPVDTLTLIGRRGDPKRIARAEQLRLVTDARQKLAALIPADATALGVQTEIEVLIDRDPARAISAEARRFGPDLLCLGSPRRGRMAETLLGSVVKRVMTDNDEPVLLVRPTPA